jgi:transposase
MNELYQERVYFSDVLKLRIIQEVLSGSISKEAAKRKYGIRGNSAILKWMRKFGYIGNPYQPTEVMESKDLSDDPADLKLRIKELEKALADAKLSSEAYSTMIDIAEQEFKIPIRKKFVTKQSDK